MQLPRIPDLILTVTLSITLTRAEPTCNNGGELFCCQAAVAGDTKPIETAAAIANYKLNPNDVTCVLSEHIWTGRHSRETIVG